VAGPRQIVDAPTFTPSAYGLLSVVQRPNVDSTHWQNGVTWSSYCPETMGDSTYDECIAVTGTPDAGVPEPSVKTGNVTHELRGATPFTAYTRFDCAPVGNEEAQRIATNALAQVEEWQVERVFWTGLVDDKTLAFPHLAANAEVVDNDGVLLQPTASTAVTGVAVDVVTGLGRLEQALANCYGGRGVIHVPLELLPTLAAYQLIAPVGSRDVGTGQFGRTLQTVAGNMIAVGAGYPGTGPTGTDPGDVTTWMYATGSVFMYRSDVKVNPFSSTVNRNNNTIEMIAERTYVIGFDCCLHAVQVNVGVPS
jgi:hypothetical protein